MSGWRWHEQWIEARAVSGRRQRGRRAAAGGGMGEGYEERMCQLVIKFKSLCCVRTRT